MDMNNRQKTFCKEYLIDFNASRAYRVAFPGCTTKTAGVQGHHLLKNPKIQEYLAKQMKKRFEKLDINVDQVVQLIWDTATADPNELIEVRRRCCRHCHGKDHKAQFTPAEWDDQLKGYLIALNRFNRDGAKGDPPILDERGGVGYDARLDPHPDCPECFGEGISHVDIKNTKDLSPAAKRLYAGAKVTRNGIEILTHSRDKNIEMLGRYLKMFVDRKEHSGPNGKPIIVNLTDKDDADL